MTVKQATAGKAFDTNTPLNSAEAKAFVDAGYIAVGRYFPRTPALVAGNLTGAEQTILIAAGLAVFAVQHVSPDNWMPTAALGQQYGKYGGEYLNGIGYGKLAVAFLDLEMVSPHAEPADTIAYCKAWFDEITAAGFTPGLYVGWQTGLTQLQLYALPFKSYWKGYNADIPVPVRGYQILQEPQETLGGITFDPNTVQADRLKDLPYWLTA
jgi:hypothetical protein